MRDVIHGRPVENIDALANPEALAFFKDIPEARSAVCPRSEHVLGLGPHGFHRLHYTEWGDPANARVLVCAHGLTRNGRDFDILAQALQPAYRVVCPDLPGRGLSDWLADPADYGYPLYLNDMAVLLARLKVEQVDWLGTSLGGLWYAVGGPARYPHSAAPAERHRTLRAPGGP